VKELTDWIRANPNKLSYGAVVGGIGHLHAANFLRKQNLTGTVIAFKGGPDSMTALAQGELQMCITALPLIIPFKGKVRALAVMTDQRSALAPDVPTYKELGLDLPELDYWGGFAVPAGTPAATIASINRTMNEVLKHPSVTGKYMAQGMVAKGSSSEALTKMISEDLRWMTPYANELNLKAG
jgi:tripartite-type tricarboxylate transporter receptor subunit TctC